LGIVAGGARSSVFVALVGFSALGSEFVVALAYSEFGSCHHRHCVGWRWAVKGEGEGGRPVTRRGSAE